MDGYTPVWAEDMSEELSRRLRNVERTISPREIAELWVFPPLPDLEYSAEFLLFTRFAEGEDRRLYSARLPGPHAVDGEGAGPPADAPLPGQDNGHPPRMERIRAGNGHPPGTENGARAESRQEIREHGTVPADRVPRLVQGLLRRLGEDAQPLHVVIDGSAGRWKAFLRRDEGAPSNGGSPGGHAEQNGDDAPASADRGAAGSSSNGRR